MLEASGWKGVAQTAAANDPAVRRFVETAVTALAAQGQARVDRMRARRPRHRRRDHAATPATPAGSGRSPTTKAWRASRPACSWCYELTPELAAQPGVARVDSCATADHPMIDHIWHERLALCDRLIAVKRARAAVRAGLPARGAAPRRARRGQIAARPAARATRQGQVRPGAQQPADHLAGGGHRHLRDEGDLARIFMRGQPRAHEALDVGGKRV